MTTFNCPINLGQHHKGIEWAGLFKTSDDTHVWSMQKVDNKYADPSMKIAVFPIDGPSKDNIGKLESDAAELLKGDCEIVKDGDFMKRVSSEGTCYELQVGKGENSTFTMDTFGIRGVVVYTQHLPTEFKRDQHYFQNSKGHPNQAIAEE